MKQQAETLITFFVPVVTGLHCYSSLGPWNQWVRKVWGKESLSSVQIRNDLKELNTQKTGMSTPTSAEGAGWCHCKPTLDHPWKFVGSREVPDVWKKENTLFSARARENIEETTEWSVSPYETDETTNLETVSEYMEGKKVKGNSQWGSLKWKLQMPDWPYSLPQWVSRWGETGKYCLLLQDFWHCLP